jgi:hypothetical protein
LTARIERQKREQVLSQDLNLEKSTSLKGLQELKGQKNEQVLAQDLKSRTGKWLGLKNQVEKKMEKWPTDDNAATITTSILRNFEQAGWEKEMVGKTSLMLYGRENAAICYLYTSNKQSVYKRRKNATRANLL